MTLKKLCNLTETIIEILKRIVYRKPRNTSNLIDIHISIEERLTHTKYMQ